MANISKRRRVSAIKVNQWLRSWDLVQYDAKQHRTKPEPHFYLFSLPAAELRSLCGIFRRETTGTKARAADLGIQRQHDPERSEEISRFVDAGYPWSTLSDAKRNSGEYEDLRKPGWLPTAVVINILKLKNQREKNSVSSNDIVNIEQKGETYQVELPYEKWSGDWKPKTIPPFEVIDGQHRLWAFDPNDTSSKSFEVPVVAFHGLDVGWQAYLFWTINVKPKRINTSLAFDLYPLLRAEDWLERAEEHIVYRDTRSQELTEAIWSHPDSPWYDRINMLGETKNPWVRQAAWIHSLSATFVRAWVPKGARTGGLFGGRMEDGDVLGWSRPQQAAFLIYCWRQFRARIYASRERWAISLRKDQKNKIGDLKIENDPAFYGELSLINTDQGVRGFLQVINDVCYAMAPGLDFRSWSPGRMGLEVVSENVISEALKTLGRQKFCGVIQELTQKLTAFDWRTSKAPDLSEDERRLKLVFRGSGGYKELRSQLLKCASENKTAIGKAASKLLEATS